MAVSGWARDELVDRLTCWPVGKGYTDQRGRWSYLEAARAARGAAPTRARDSRGGGEEIVKNAVVSV
jgi:hypothetical protein